MTLLISKIIDFLSKPINTGILTGLFLSSTLLFLFNFLPEKILTRMNMMNFFNQSNYIIVIVMVLSFFLLIVQLFSMVQKRRQDKKFSEFFQKQQEELFNDPDALRILKQLYENHPDPVNLPIQNQKVKLLESFQLIIRTTSQIFINGPSELQSPHFPFVMQPDAEKKMKDLYK